VRVGRADDVRLRQVVGFADQRFGLAPLFRRPLGENVRHRPRFRKLFLESFAVAVGQRGRVMFRSQPRPIWLVCGRKKNLGLDDLEAFKETLLLGRDLRLTVDLNPRLHKKLVHYYTWMTLISECKKRCNITAIAPRFSIGVMGRGALLLGATG
jgi:hypothetical protein